MNIPNNCQCGFPMVSCEGRIIKYKCGSWCPPDGVMRYSLECKDKQITDLKSLLQETNIKLEIWRKSRTALYCFSHHATPGKGTVNNALKIYQELSNLGEFKWEYRW